MSVSQNFIILGGQYITDFETTSVPEDHKKKQNNEQQNKGNLSY